MTTPARAAGPARAAEPGTPAPTPARAAETAPARAAETAPARAAEGPSTGRTRLRRAALLRLLMPVLLVVVGIGVLAYPVVATEYNNRHQREFAAKYNSDVQQADQHQLDQSLERAHEYNTGLAGVPILDPWLSSAQNAVDGSPYANYMTQLSDFDAMAVVRVPAARINLPVRHGTGDTALATGAGHLYGTSLPVGGEGTHAVMTSHTGFANATLFDHLKEVKDGDLMYIDVHGQTLAYAVDQIKVVLPNEISDLHPVAGQDLITLFTCTPYGVNSHRLLVRGHRVAYDPAVDRAAAPQEGFHLEGWMWGLLGGVAGGVVLLAVIVGNELRRRRAALKTPAARAAGAGARTKVDDSLVDVAAQQPARGVDEAPAAADAPPTRPRRAR